MKNSLLLFGLFLLSSCKNLTPEQNDLLLRHALSTSDILVTKAIK